jgi:hypothetical protein
MSATTRILSLCLLVCSAAACLYGQGGAYGTLLGTVTDNSGAVVANASVDVTNTATNITNHVQTTSSGDYTVPYLQPGSYRVTVQASGFQKIGHRQCELGRGAAGARQFLHEAGCCFGND